MSWDAERSRSGKQPFQYVEIELDRCSRIYGDAFTSPPGSPLVGCQAQVGVTGADKCYNSWETCQDETNFNPLSFWVRFCEQTSDAPRSFNFDVASPSDEGLAVFLPLLRRVQYSPGLPEPGESLGQRSQLKVEFSDAPHHDIGIDKYVTERAFDPMTRGMFFRKLKARWPHYIGRRLRWYQGYIRQERTGYLSLPGTAGNFASTPDSPAVSIIADIDVRAKAALDDWTPAVFQVFISKDDVSGANREWQLGVKSDGAFQFTWWDSGGTLRQVASSVANGISDGTVKHVRATLDVDNGAGGHTVQFLLSDDGLSWTQLGTDQNAGAFTTSIRDQGSLVRVGGVGDSSFAAGKFYYAELRNGIDGSVVAAFDPGRASTGAREFMAETGEIWTVNQSGSPFAELIAWERPAATINDFRMREYVMERFEGPGADGRVAIVAKDVLKLLDDDRAQAPMKSKGELVNAMLASESPDAANIDVSTSELTEYDLTGSPSIGYVRIGGEVITYTGTAVQSATVVRLTGVTRAAPSPYTTEMKQHDAGDAVQLCVYFVGTIPEVVRELMVTYGNISSAFIPFTDWETEATTWLASDNISRLVTEPQGLKSLIDEIIQETLTWGFWFDEVEQEIKFRAVRPADIGDTVVDLSDDANIVADSVKLTDDPNRVINEVQMLYGQIDPTKRKDELDNYRKGLLVADADSQSTNEIGQRRIKRVFSRWNSTASESVVLRYAERTLASRSRNLATIEFKVDRKDEDIGTAQFADLQTLYLIDQFGLPVTTRMQIMRVDSAEEQVTYRAREDFFGAALFARWAPAALEGLFWGDATAAQREQYLFWADSNGDLGSLESPANPTDGKTWA